MNDDLEGKLQRVMEALRSLSSAVVSYSGGVDSTLLAALAYEALGSGMLAVHISSPLQAPRETERAIRTADILALPLMALELDEMSLPGFDGNPPDRCHICKKHRLAVLGELARAEGYAAVLDGSNADDEAAHRPGRKALRECGVHSPLGEAGLAKAEVRALARTLGLPNWDAPARPCLATRFPYGAQLDAASLRMVDGAEAVLEGMGARQVRVRVDAPGEARIELGEGDMGLLDEGDNRDRLVDALCGLGFSRILLDREGYRSGSMDEPRRIRRCITLFAAGDNA